MATRRFCDICGEDMGPSGGTRWLIDDVELKGGFAVCYDIKTGTRRVPDGDSAYLRGDVCMSCLGKALAIAFDLHEPCACKPPPVMVPVPPEMDIPAFSAGYIHGWCNHRDAGG